jgi:isoquinoline 1-oxidoreductase subunit beta
MYSSTEGFVRVHRSFIANVSKVTNFHQNKLLRMNECPPMEVHFVESDDERPWRIGEISSPLAIPAVLNAIYSATGKRLRSVPIDLA